MEGTNQKGAAGDEPLVGEGAQGQRRGWGSGPDDGARGRAAPRRRGSLAIKPLRSQATLPLRPDPPGSVRLRSGPPVVVA